MVLAPRLAGVGVGVGGGGRRIRSTWCNAPLSSPMSTGESDPERYTSPPHPTHTHKVSVLWIQRAFSHITMENSRAWLGLGKQVTFRSFVLNELY